MTSPWLNLLVGGSGYGVVVFVAALVVFIKFSQSSKASVLVNVGKAFPFSVLVRLPSWTRYPQLDQSLGLVRGGQV